MEEWSLKRILIKNIYGGRLIEYFMIAAISSILVIRLYLNATGYPQIGFGQFHIAHVLWGGILMMVGTIFILAYLSGTARTIGAIISGVGFGAFIDEIGKFITSDNNYFFQPTAAIIYAIFVLLFLFLRFYARDKDFSKEEYLANALELLEDTVFNDLDTDEKTQIKRFLSRSNPNHQLTVQLKQFIKNFEAEVPESPILIVRLRDWLANTYHRLVLSKWFTRGLIIFFITNALIAIVQALQFGRLLYKVGYQPYLQLTVPQIGEILFAFLAAIPIIIGTLRMRSDRIWALRMYRYSVLLNIFLVQFFEFYQDNFSAVFGLFGNILLLVALNYMISREQTIAEKKS